MESKFKVGQKVKVINDGEIGEILSFSYDSENGFKYTISSKEVDIPNKAVIDGVKTCLEAELEEVKDEN